MCDDNALQKRSADIAGENLGELLKIVDDLKSDGESDSDNRKTMRVSIASLETLGVAVSSVVPMLRAAAENNAANGQQLYTIANACVGDTLKAAKNGNFWGALKTADGTSKMAQLQEAGSVDISSAAALPFGAATIMMAVALHSIEQKLDRIEKLQKQIFDFLTCDKESEIEADVQMLFGILAQYKFNWDNGHYIASSHKMVLDIKRAALKNVRAYQKTVTGEIEKKALFALRNDVDSALANLMNQFKYYRMSIFAYALSSLAEIMLGGNFKEEYIGAVKTEIEELAADYRGFFEKASDRLGKLSGDALDTAILKGIGTAGKSVGKFFGSIPGIRNTSVDKLLQESGDGLVDKASVIEEKAVRRFAELGNPCTSHIAELMQNMTAIFNRTERICFDADNIYLVRE